MERGWNMGGCEKKLPIVIPTRLMSVGDPQSNELWEVKASAPSKASIRILFNFRAASYHARTHIKL